MAEETTPESTEAGSPESQAQQQTGSRQVRLRVNQTDAHTSYANAFRTNVTAEEVFVDFGLNQVVPAQPGQGGPGQENIAGEILFDVKNRVILNYYSTKRLAISLADIVRKYEQQFGELQLNAADRVEKK